MSADTRFRRRSLGLLILVVICFAIFVRYFGMTGEDLTLGGGYEVQAMIPDIGGLALNADVRQAGVTVGKVKDVATRGDNAAVLLEIEDKYAPIHRDAEVLVREKTPVGERYIELFPGRPQRGELPSGAVLPLGQTREAVTIDHVLSTFDRRTRRDLRRLLRGLGRGLEHRGEDLNRFFEANAALAEEGGPVARVLREERAQVGTLIDDFGRVMAALGDREQDIRLLARQGKLAAEAVASRDRQLGETLEELPATVRQVRGTATRLASFSHLATPVLGDMRIAFEDLAPAVHELRPAAAAGRRTMRELGGFARQAVPLLVNLRRFSNRGAKSIPPLDRFLGEYGPFARYAAPYDREFAAFFSNTRSSVGTRVDPGQVARIHFVISESTYAASRGEERRAYDALLSTGLLSTTRSVGKNPYPAPGTLGDPRPFEGNYTRVEADD